MDKSSGVLWSRGFFRLWVLCSVAWVLAMTLAGVNSLPSEYAQQTFVSDRVTGLGAAFAKHGPSYAQSGEFGYIDLHNLRAALSKAEKANDQKSALEFKVAITNLESEYSTQLWDAVAVFAIFALSVPIVVLVIGLCVRWVIRGFRSA